MINASFVGPDGHARCGWCTADPAYMAYHDTEWGFPVGDDNGLFEKLCLEGFQSGLSWRTILAKRENFRAAFDGFDIAKVARYKARDVDRLLQDAGIVRHRGKIEAVIHNAALVQDLIQQEGSLAACLWRYEPARLPSAHAPSTAPKDAASLLSKALKKQGWQFVGPTTVYAFMQSMGLVNDHPEGCFVHRKAESARQRFKRPAA